MNIRQWYRGGQSGALPISLDYSTFDILYSFRKLNPDYNGVATVLRRDSDGDIEGFNFDGNNLPESTILSWAGNSAFRLETKINQGFLANKFDLKYVQGTRSLLGTNGVFNRSNGKISLLGQTGNRYANDTLTIPESAFANYGVFSSVITTQNGINDQGYLGEVAFPISGNVGKGYVSSTSAGRNIMRWIETGYYSQSQLLIAQATQNEQRQYSRIFLPNVGITGSSFRYNSIEQNNRPQVKEWANPNVTSVQMFFMSGILGTFLGQFQEASWKSYSTPNEIEQAEIMTALEAEQNAYYGIY